MKKSHLSSLTFVFEYFSAVYNLASCAKSLLFQRVHRYLIDRLKISDFNVRSTYTEYQIVKILKEVEAGRLVKEVLREYGISDVVYYRWKQGLRMRMVILMRKP